MEKTKILIVEDETITALFIQECLENLGYKVVETAVTGYDAIDIAEEYRPDLVLMDIKLTGDLNGIETAKIIYDRFNIPVVYLTAYSDDKTLQKAKLTGSFGYLRKPVEEKVLYPTIEIALSKHQEESKLKNTNQWLSTMIRNLNDAIIAIDTNGLIKFINHEAEKISGWKKEEINDKYLNEIFQFKNKGRSIEEQLIFLLSNSGKDNMTILLTKNNKKITVEYNLSTITDNQNTVHGFILTFFHPEKMPEKTNFNNESLNKIKQLNNLIGICSFCRKIRDDQGQWSQLESYLQKQFDILFSHGVCPECSKKYYGEYLS